MFPGRDRQARFSGGSIEHVWQAVRARAGLEDIDCIISDTPFGSRALALGESLTMIGNFLGHTQSQTAARYTHLANESLKASGSQVGDSIGSHITPVEPYWVIPGTTSCPGGLLRRGNGITERQHTRLGQATAARL